MELSKQWSHLGWGGSQGSSGSRCVRFERDVLTEAQLAALEAITLVPMDSQCSSDGYYLQELTVFDADGTYATYRDTGCSYLGIDSAKAMLPSDAFDGETFATGGTACGDASTSN